jgi:ribosome biogenesis GTPase / thiamine phosphate phosphatase
MTDGGAEFEGLVRRVDARGCEVVPAAGGEPIFAGIRGRVHRFSRTERSPLAPGDRVVVAPTAGGASVRSVLPRRSRFARESSSGGRPQVVAANVDLAVALLPAAEPAPNPRLADRVLAAAAHEGVAGAVVVSKADLVEEAVVEDLLGLYRAAGVRTLAVSVVRERGLAEMEDLLRGRTSVIAGPSGGGKSTLLKRLLGPAAAGVRTGLVNARTGKGRHTTTASQLLPFPGGGWVVDTPGVRTLALPDMRPADLSVLFPDLERLGPCRFPDCSHTHEPGCAAAAAVAAGTLDPRRLDSFRSILVQIKEDSDRRAW